MKHLIHSICSTGLLLAIASFSHAQAKPVASPADIAKVYDRLLPQIDKIPIYDNHSHATFPDDFDMDAAFEAFFGGVSAHDQGAKVCDAALDESK